MNKRGMTLMELIVYMAIVGIVVVIAGTAFTSSTKMRIRTESKLTALAAAEEVAAILKEDVAQMGAKSSMESRTITSDSFYVSEDVFIDPSNSDRSSYVLKKSSDGKDSLYFRKIRFDDNGSYAAVEEISWYMDGDELIRSCRTRAKKTAADEMCPENSALEMVMAQGVDSFKVVPAIPSVLEANSSAGVLFPSGSDQSLFRLVSRYDGSTYFRTTIDPESGGSSVMLSGFVSNYDYENETVESTKKVNEVYAAEVGGTDGSFGELCTQMTFDVGMTYQIIFGISKTSIYDKSQMFIPGRDHLAVGFRTTAGAKTVIKDMMFYPPMSSEMDLVKRKINFNVSQKVEKVCLVFDVAAYSPALSSGTFNISGLQVVKIPEGFYTFDESQVNSITAADKKNVKAFRLVVSLRKNDEEGRVSVDVAVPSNGAE